MASSESATGMTWATSSRLRPTVLLGSPRPSYLSWRVSPGSRTFSSAENGAGLSKRTRGWAEKVEGGEGEAVGVMRVQEDGQAAPGGREVTGGRDEQDVEPVHEHRRPDRERLPRVGDRAVRGPPAEAEAQRRDQARDVEL